MLTPQTIQELQNEQQKLDEFIIQKKNLTDIDNKVGFIRTKIALLVEIGEFANELATFKHWKKSTEINLEQAREELIDCLHFYLSWANNFQIDFFDYKFRKLVPEPDYNELLLALFSETEVFSINPLWKKTKQKMIAAQKKSWEESKKKLNPADKDYKKELETYREIEEVQKKIIEKAENSFSAEIEVEKNKASFYRWLIIFEELCQKLGMESEAEIKKVYLAKNKKNWERQNQNY